MVKIIEKSYEERVNEKNLEGMVAIAREIFIAEHIPDVKDDILANIGFAIYDSDNPCVIVSHLLGTISVHKSEYFDRALELGKRIEAKYPIEFELYEEYGVEPPTV